MLESSLPADWRSLVLSRTTSSSPITGSWSSTRRYRWGALLRMRGTTDGPNSCPETNCPRAALMLARTRACCIAMLDLARTSPNMSAVPGGPFKRRSISSGSCTPDSPAVESRRVSNCRLGAPGGRGRALRASGRGGLPPRSWKEASLDSSVLCCSRTCTAAACPSSA